MGKNFRIPPDWVGFTLFSVVLVSGLVLRIIGVRANYPFYRDPGFYVMIASIYLPLMIRSFEFSTEELCVTYAFFFKRHICTDRISSIRFVAERGKPGLAIFLDGQGAATDNRLFFKAVFHPRRIIRISIWEDDVEDYLKKLSALYNNVRLGDSYIAWKMLKAKQKLKR